MERRSTKEATYDLSCAFLCHSLISPSISGCLLFGHLYRSDTSKKDAIINSRKGSYSVSPEAHATLIHHPRTVSRRNRALPKWTGTFLSWPPKLARLINILQESILREIGADWRLSDDVSPMDDSLQFVLIHMNCLKIASLQKWSTIFEYTVLDQKSKIKNLPWSSQHRTLLTEAFWDRS